MKSSAASPKVGMPLVTVFQTSFGSARKGDADAVGQFVHRDKLRSQRYGAHMLGAIRTDGLMRGVLAGLFEFALLLRIAVPAGFMPTQTSGGIVISVCDGMGSGKMMLLDVGLPDDDQQHPEQEKLSAPCAFASAAAPMLHIAPTLAAALPGMVLREFALPPPARFAVARTDFLSPPLRGPPARA
jgi:hypothetical protein